MLKRFLNDESAQGMTEYVLLVFLIALLAYVAVKTFGTQVKTKFTEATRKLRAAK